MNARANSFWMTGSRREGGYFLLMLMLMVTVLVITAAAVAPSIIHQIQRDREEELIHRGVQYSRAIRRYVKKFGRYPTRIEELENTNNLRFLRKRYKDPITGEDFKILHLGDVQLTFGPGIAGATPVGGDVSVGTAPQRAKIQKAAASAASDNAASPDGSEDTSSQGSSADAASTKVTSGADPAKQGSSGPRFGGGPIVGVASLSKEKSIREFNQKDHYNQWQFIYDPGTDRGGLLNTPAQPLLKGAVPVPQQGLSGIQSSIQPQPAPGEGTQQNPPPAQQSEQK